MRDTLLGGCAWPLSSPLSESSQVPSQATTSLFLGPDIGLSMLPGIGPWVALSGGGSIRDGGLDSGPPPPICDGGRSLGT